MFLEAPGLHKKVLVSASKGHCVVVMLIEGRARGDLLFVSHANSFTPPAGGVCVFSSGSED